MDSKEKLLDMLYAMLKIRRVEERISESFAQGKIPGFLHVSIGQEAVSAGFALACATTTPFLPRTEVTDRPWPKESI